MPGAGKLDQRVTIQAEGRTTDTAGGGVIAWADVATVYASVREPRGREIQQADQLQGRVVYLVEMRYRAGITAKHRLVWRGNALNIREVQDLGPRSGWLTLVAELGAGT